jgi:hypothetical protein
MECQNTDKCISYLGSEEEVNISLDLIDGYAMADYDFTIEVYCSSLKKQIFTKQQATRIDDNNYTVIVETIKIGVGDVKIRVVGSVPNRSYPGKYRDVVTYLDPNMRIVR